MARLNTRNGKQMNEPVPAQGDSIQVSGRADVRPPDVASAVPRFVSQQDLPQGSPTSDLEQVVVRRSTGLD